MKKIVIMNGEEQPKKMNVEYVVAMEIFMSVVVIIFQKELVIVKEM